MGSNNGRREQDELRARALAAENRANEAIKKAEQPDPFEQRRREYITKILDYREGKNGPPRVRDFPDQMGIALYNDAKQSKDAGRVGRGYGTLADGANPNFSAALDKEMTLERDQRASGMLESYISDALNAADVESGNLAAMGNARNMNIASMRNSNFNSSEDRYLQMLMRPRQPSFLKQFALGALNTFQFAPIKI